MAYNKWVSGFTTLRPNPCFAWNLDPRLLYTIREPVPLKKKQGGE